MSDEQERDEQEQEDGAETPPETTGEHLNVEGDDAGLGGSDEPGEGVGGGGGPSRVI